MSADNGIYILKTKDQYRVIHAQAIENLTWSHIDGDISSIRPRQYVPTRVAEYFGNQKYTRNLETACKIAEMMLRKTPVCEYGIRMLAHYNKTWKHIVEDAKLYAKKEIEELRNKDSYDWQIQKLQAIIDGELN